MDEFVIINIIVIISFILMIIIAIFSFTMFMIQKFLHNKEAKEIYKIINDICGVKQTVYFYLDEKKHLNLLKNSTNNKYVEFTICGLYEFIDKISKYWTTDRNIRIDFTITSIENKEIEVEIYYFHNFDWIKVTEPANLLKYSLKFEKNDECFLEDINGKYFESWTFKKSNIINYTSAKKIITGMLVLQFASLSYLILLNLPYSDMFNGLSKAFMSIKISDIRYYTIVILLFIIILSLNDNKKNKRK